MSQFKSNLKPSSSRTRSRHHALRLIVRPSARRARFSPSASTRAPFSCHTSPPGRPWRGTSNSSPALHRIAAASAPQASRNSPASLIASRHSASGTERRRWHWSRAHPQCVLPVLPPCPPHREERPKARPGAWIFRRHRKNRSTVRVPPATYPTLLGRVHCRRLLKTEHSASHSGGRRGLPSGGKGVAATATWPSWTPP